MSDKNSPTPKPQADELPSQCLKSYNQTSPCLSCGKVGITNVVNKCNIVAIISCICVPCCWEIYGALKFKDPNCYDANHHCNTCGNLIYEYKAC